MNQTEFRISSSRPLISVQDIVSFIDKGEEYKKSLVKLEKIDDDVLNKFIYGIILTPDYQRQ